MDVIVKLLATISCSKQLGVILFVLLLRIFPHRKALLCTLVSILSGQHCPRTGTDVDIRLLHHVILLETGRRKESTTKGAGINHLAFVIEIQKERDRRTGC